MVRKQIRYALDTVFETLGPQPAVGRRAGYGIDPDACAGLVDLTEDHSAGLDSSPAHAGSSQGFGPCFADG
jgi:hypothetical protein